MDQQTTQSDDRLREPADSPLQISPLVSRLTRRATAPIGLIDTHHPQYLQARSLGVAADRSGWTERLRARYLSEESGASSQGLLYAGAGDPLPDGAGVTESNGLLMAGQSALSIAPRDSSSTALISRAADSSPSLARVSRRGSPQPPNASLVQRKVAANDGPRLSDATSAFRPGERTPGDEKTSISSSTAPPTGAAPVAQRRAAERPRNGGTAPSMPSAPSAGETAIRRMPLLFPVKGSVDVRPSGAHSGQAASGRAPLQPGLSESGAGRGPVQSEIQRQPREQSGGNESGSSRGVDAGPAAPPLDSGAVTGRTWEMTTARSSPRLALLIQRRSADRGGGHSLPASASEPVIRPLESPRMIWRKAESGNEPPSMSGYRPLRSPDDDPPSLTGYRPLRSLDDGPEIPAPAQQIETVHSAYASGPSVRQTVSTAPAPAQSSAPNLELLAEQVSRILARRLEAERERRGIKR
jgi:hypothetical protein